MRDCSAITDCPHIRVTRNLKNGINNYSAFRQFERQTLQDRTRRNTGGPDKCAGRYGLSVITMYNPIGVGGHPCAQLDVNLAFPEFLLSVKTKCFAAFRKYDFSAVYQYNPDFTRVDPAVGRKALPAEVIDGSYSLDAGEAATGDHKGQHSFPPHRVTLQAGAFQHGDYRGSE